VLGEPKEMRDSERLWVYPYDVALVRFYGVLGAIGWHHKRLLIVTFDEDGTLHDRRVIKDEWLWRRQPLPDEILRLR